MWTHLGRIVGTLAGSHRLINSWVTAVASVKERPWNRLFRDTCFERRHLSLNTGFAIYWLGDSCIPNGMGSGLGGGQSWLSFLCCHESNSLIPFWHQRLSSLIPPSSSFDAHLSKVISKPATPSLAACRKSLLTSPFSHLGTLNPGPTPYPQETPKTSPLLAFSQAIFRPVWEPTVLSLESLIMWEIDLLMPSWCMCSVTSLGPQNQFWVGAPSHLSRVTPVETMRPRDRGRQGI